MSQDPPAASAPQASRATTPQTGQKTSGEVKKPIYSKSYNDQSTNLYPIRIDVESDDKNIRIVDTLIVDVNCWPIPIYHPMIESVERNVRELSYCILSDMEVQSMGRTVRHFTGRLDLWTSSIQEKIEEQIRPQVWKIITNEYHPISHVNHQQQQQQGQQQGQSQQRTSTNGTNNLIDISIRLVINGIVIHEDIQWDVHVPLSPFEYAKDMGKELNLPEEAIIAIATTILEQIYGLSVTDRTQDESSGTMSTTTTSRRGAWMLDPKENSATVNQIVAQHKPK